MPAIENRYRSLSQVAAPGARTRGMIQNAAITGALAPQGSTASVAAEKPSSGTGVDGQVVGTSPNVSRPQTITDTPPAPAGAPTPGSLAPPPPVPGFTQTPRGPADFARLGGGFGQADTNSLKHTFGRIAQYYEHTPQGLQALLQDAEFRNYFPNARLDKNDWIDFGGQIDPHSGAAVGKVDVIHAFDPTMQAGNNKNWQWLTEEEALAGAQGGATLAPIQPQGPSYTSQLLAQIMSQLNRNRGY